MIDPGDPGGRSDHRDHSDDDPPPAADSSAPVDAIDEEPVRQPRFRDVLRYFLGLGSWGFGGPIATVGYMQRDLVERRRWVDRKDFLNGVALGQTMPGPLAAQVTMWVGYRRRGAVGALAVSVAFILPSFLVVLGVAVLYVRYQGLDWVQALFYGIAPGVIAIIALAAVKLARLTNTVDRRLWVISAVLATVTAVTGAEIAVLFVAAGLLMVAIDAPPSWLRRRPDSLSSLWMLGSAHGPWIELGATGSTQAALAGFFFKAGAFIFGSGLAIVPFLRQGVVHDHHWMTEAQFLDAVAMGLITPGPVVISATFIGYFVGGLTGAVVATVAIFVPIYLGVVIPGRWFIRHSDHPQLQAFVKGATAAAAGAIAGAVVVLGRDAITDIRTGAIALVALVLLWRYKVKEPYIVGLAAIAGLVLYTA